jgi:hypothetical protein
MRPAGHGRKQSVIRSIGHPNKTCPVKHTLMSGHEACDYIELNSDDGYLTTDYIRL